jgi:hypothetical protein
MLRRVSGSIFFLGLCWTACTNLDVTAATKLNTSVRTAASVERTGFYYESLPGAWDGFSRGCFVRLIISLLQQLCEENTLLDFGCCAP